MSALILGAGRGQIPLMDLCHQYGRRVVAVSPEGDYPGLKVADEVVFENVKDYEAIYEKVKGMNISAVVTDQLDAGVLSAAYLAEKLKIRGIGFETAKLFTDKYAMRRAAEQAGVDVPRSIRAKSADEALRLIAEEGLAYPLMMKPVDNGGSRGVYQIKSAAELKEKFSESLSRSQSGSVIIEEFITGREYVVEAFTRDYTTANLIVGHRDYFDVPGTFIPNATVFTDADSADSALEQRIKETNLRLIESMKLPFGITHAEYLYDAQADTVYLVEIAARGGGVFISSELIPAACGVNANDLLVREVLGVGASGELTLKKGAAAYFCYLTPPGVVTRLDGTEQAAQISGVRRAFFDNIRVGMKTGAITDKSSRKGPVIVEGETKADCYRVIEAVRQALHIEIENNGAKYHAVWN